MAREDDLKKIVECLRRANNSQDVGCSLLIGAGCSVTTGIPIASDFVKAIEEQYKIEYDEAAEKNYANCMDKLSPGDRRKLILQFVKKAKIN